MVRSPAPRTSSNFLQSVLLTARPDWRGKDLAAVEDKLDRIGITSVLDLLGALRSRCLNGTLRKCGEKRFTSETLAVLQKVAEASIEDGLRAEESCGSAFLESPKVAEASSEDGLRAEESYGSAFVESPQPHAAWSKTDEPCVKQRPPEDGDDEEEKEDKDSAPEENTSSETLEVADGLSRLSSANSWSELKLRGLSPLPGREGPEEILSFLHETERGYGMSLEELREMCNLQESPELEEVTQVELLQRLRHCTWHELGIPVELFDSMTAAHGVREYVENLSTRTLPELLSVAQQKGLKVGVEPDAEILWSRLRNVAVWEQLPPEVLLRICEGRGLSCLNSIASETDTYGSPQVWSSDDPGPYYVERQHLICELIESDWLHAQGSGPVMSNDPESLGLLDSPLKQDETTWQDAVFEQTLDLKVPFHEEECLVDHSNMRPEYQRFLYCIQTCANIGVVDHRTRANLDIVDTCAASTLPLKDDYIAWYADADTEYEQVDTEEEDDEEEEADTEGEQERVHVFFRPDLAVEDAQSHSAVVVAVDCEDLTCAQCHGRLPAYVELAEDGHIYCDLCWEQFLCIESADGSPLAYQLRQVDASPNSLEASPKPVLNSVPSMRMHLPPVPALRDPQKQPAVSLKAPALAPCTTPMPDLGLQAILPALSTACTSSSCPSLGDVLAAEPLVKQTCLGCSPPLQIPAVEIPALGARTSVDASATSQHHQSCIQGCVATPRWPRTTMSESTMLRSQTAGLQRSEVAKDYNAHGLAAPSRNVITSDQAVQVDNTSSRTIPVRFLYSSPILIGNQGLALNVCADLECVQAAEGIRAEVRVATIEGLREALLVRTSPEILHISAHCMALAGTPSLILEDTKSAAHPVSVSDLSSIGPWDGLGLLVLLACNSELIVQRLLQKSGLRRAVCCTAPVLDRAAHRFCKGLYQALGAGYDLLRSFEVAQAGVRISPDPCLRQEGAKFRLLGDTISDASGQVWSPVALALSQQPHVLWPSWPRVENYVGREAIALHLAAIFQQRRAICVWGDEGSGKTALCTEFCRHFSSPGGRRFSSRALLIDYARVIARNPRHPELALSFAILTELHHRSFMASTTGLACLETSSQSRDSLLRLARELDERGPCLLVVDGFTKDENSTQTGCCCSDSSDAGDTGACPELHGRSFRKSPQNWHAVHSLLADLLQVSTQLCILMTARSPPRGRFACLGPSKVVEVHLPSLAPEDTAVLLARRASRPFFHRDFVSEKTGCACSSVPLKLDQELIGLISESPLAQMLRGNPGRIISAAADVHAELPSLLEHPWLKSLPKLVAQLATSP